MRGCPIVASLVLCCSAAAQELPAEPPRAELAIPEQVWREVLHAVQQPGPALGYGGDVMRNYKYDTHLLRTVEVLFSDIRAVPRYSGKISDELLAAARDPAQLIWLGYVLTDVSAGRSFPVPEALQEEEVDWGVDWLGRGTSPDEAIRDALARLGTIAGRPTAEHAGDMPAAWEEVPSGIRKLLARQMVAIAESAPYLARGMEANVAHPLMSELGRPDLENLYKMAVGPWIDERQWQFVTNHHETFRWLDAFDRRSVAFGSILYARLAWKGLSEYAAAPPESRRADADARFGVVRIPTALGEIIVQDAGAQTLRGDTPLLILDVGGDDIYTGHIAVPAHGRSPIGVLIDLGGDDRYGDEETFASFGAGLFGMGVLFELGGNDRYLVRRSSLGSAHFGTGLLYDFDGDDTYEVGDRFGQGAGIAGLGMLVDIAGDDTYTCGSYSQGMGGTLGAGVLLDVSGRDKYIARDDGNISEMYLNRSVAMSQGCGWGRRADFGDGHTLAGGVGVLVDGGGDDVYSAQVWAQGCGFWWGLGILEDRAGNDVYRNGKYAAGSAAHFAIGVCVDLSGDDVHNQDNDATSMNQFMGHARDGSIGVFIDGAGNDRYVLRDHCGGSGDLGSIGLFWDRGGDDVYTMKPWQEPDLPENGWNNLPPLGTSTWYAPMRSFRDDIPTFGIFLDTGGKDVYEGQDPREADSRPREGGTWSMFHPWGTWGIGMDIGTSAPAVNPRARD